MMIVVGKAFDDVADEYDDAVSDGTDVVDGAVVVDEPPYAGYQYRWLLLLLRILLLYLRLLLMRRR